MKYHIWEEGYACTGESAESFLAGTFEADSFDEACWKLVAERAKNPKGWGEASLYHSVKNGKHYWWGCGWYPTREEASYFDRH